MTESVEPVNPTVEQRIQQNMGFIVSLAQRFAEGWGLDFDDLVQAGRIAVWRAAQTFDPWRGVKFLSYAGRAIKTHMLTLCRDQASPIKLPVALRSNTRLPMQDIHATSQGNHGGEMQWLEFNLPAPEPEEPYRAHIDPQVLRAAVARLKPRQRAVVELVYFECLTYEAAGKRLGVRHQAVQQRLIKALNCLRKSELLKAA